MSKDRGSIPRTSTAMKRLVRDILAGRFVMCDHVATAHVMHFVLGVARTPPLSY